MQVSCIGVKIYNELFLPSSTQDRNVLEKQEEIELY